MTNAADTTVMIVCGLALLAAMTVVQAQGLADPTRPPAMLGVPSPDSGATAGEPPATTGLQTIIHSNCGKPGAIINGQYVILGGRVGDARLVTVGEDSVTLRSAAGKETIKLIPGIEKKLTANSATEADKKWVCARNLGEGVKK